MPASKALIGKMALAHCGINKDIRDVDNDRSNEAIQIRLFYDHIIDLLLETCEWSFAKTEERLALSDATSTQWAYAYVYPADCKFAIRIQNPAARTEGSGQKIPFEVVTNKGKDGKLILTDQAEAVLEYNMPVTNPALFSTSFVQAASLGVGSHIATPLRVDPNIAKNLMNQFSNWLSEAVNFQQREQREDVDPVSEFERMRG